MVDKRSLTATAGPVERIYINVMYALAYITFTDEAASEIKKKLNRKQIVHYACVKRYKKLLARPVERI